MYLKSVYNFKPAKGGLLFVHRDFQQGDGLDIIRLSVYLNLCSLLGCNLLGTPRRYGIHVSIERTFDRKAICIYRKILPLEEK